MIELALLLFVINVIIEINNELDVFVQISKTDVGFGNDREPSPSLSRYYTSVNFWIIKFCPYFIIWEVLLAVTR